VLVRSFLPDGNEPAATLIDLTDLFVCANSRDRRPNHPDVWTRDLPGLLAEASATIERLPRPVGLAPLFHHSMAWSLGAILNPKRGVPLLLRQRSQKGNDAWWDGSEARLPADGAEWTFERLLLGKGRDLALVVSCTHHALLPNPSRASIQDGAHARWLTESFTNDPAGGRGAHAPWAASRLPRLPGEPGIPVGSAGRPPRAHHRL
jgi:hypothetical protein